MQRAREKSSARLGEEMAQENDFSEASTREDFSGNLQFLPTTPKMRAGRKGPLSMDETVQIG